MDRSRDTPSPNPTPPAPDLGLVHKEGNLALESSYKHNQTTKKSHHSFATWGLQQNAEEETSGSAVRLLSVSPLGLLLPGKGCPQTLIKSSKGSTESPEDPASVGMQCYWAP